MTVIQGLVILLAAATLYGAGILILLPSVRRGGGPDLQTRIIIVFGVKLLLGAGWLLGVWKGFGWSVTVAAFGMIAAYLLGLIAVTLTVMHELRRKTG